MADPRNPIGLRRILVLATGTNIGKTWITVSLARSLAERPGASVMALKPIESGWTNGPSSDAATLRDASNCAVAGVPRWAFLPPVSPHLAARQAGASIQLPELASWIRTSEEHHLGSSPECWTLVETAGGAFSPLGADLVNADLLRAMDFSCTLLVAPDRLGVLHDVTATLRAMAAAKLPPPLVLLNTASEPDSSTGSNAEELAALNIALPLATVPRGGAVPPEALQRLVAACNPVPSLTV